MDQNQQAIDEIIAAARDGFAQGPFDGLLAISHFYADELGVRHGEPEGGPASTALGVADQIQLEIEAFSISVEKWIVEPEFTVNDNVVTIMCSHSVDMRDGSHIEFDGDKVELGVDGGKIVSHNHEVPPEFMQLITPEVQAKMVEGMQKLLADAGRTPEEIEEQLKPLTDR